MKKTKYILVGIALLLVAFQLVPVERTNPPVEEEVVAPAEVMIVLKRSCYDCHSNKTKWPWYSHVAPVSWLVIRDVKGARKKMNFSTWNKYDAKEQAHHKKECWEETSEGEMPLWFYVPLHPNAALSEQDIQILKSWAKADSRNSNWKSEKEENEDDD